MGFDLPGTDFSEGVCCSVVVSCCGTVEGRQASNKAKLRKRDQMGRREESDWQEQGRCMARSFGVGRR